MDYITALDKAIESGLQGFKEYIQNKVTEQEDFLERFFGTADGAQRTVLNYLIHRHEESSDTDDGASLKRMEYVINLAKNKNTGAPLHQAVSEGKMKLALYLLTLPTSNHTSHNPSIFDVDLRDKEGLTLLSLVISAQWTEFLEALLKKKPNVHLPSYMSSSRVPFQPIHQAVILNDATSIRLLSQYGAQLDNPCGLGPDTPVLLAAELCKLDALDALLEQPAEQLMLEAERSISSQNNNTSKLNAIERFCQHVSEGKNTADALRGVAMLLCRGAEPPRSEAMRYLLANNRAALLKAIEAYLEDKPGLVDEFVRRCHMRESPLNIIIYDPHSSWNTIRLLLGRPSNAAFVIENLVVRKYTTNPKNPPATISTAPTEDISLETDPLKLYARFVECYTNTYRNEFFTNPLSTMRRMINTGMIDWAGVQCYVAANPRSRSRKVYDDLFKLPQKSLDDIQDNAQSTMLAP